MSNFDVNKIGIEIAFNHMRLAGYNIKRGIGHPIYLNNGTEDVPVIVWTKTYQYRKINGIKVDVTGKSKDMLDGVLKRTPGAWVVWVDARLGLIMGGELKKLMEPRTFEGIAFPYEDLTRSGKVIYFNIYLIKTICKISEDDLDKLRKATLKNRTPKIQTMLFI